ncbi:MAG: hypothetical protein JO144_05835 [Actinobacteria bacterium]|nr:hypothetical protein [Actinomycetota bacterium]
MVTPQGPESRRAPDEQELTRAAHSSDALRQLLAAAAAPPTTAELKGRSRALAAFRSVYRLRRPGAGARHPRPAVPIDADQQEPAEPGTRLSEVTDGGSGTDRRRRSGLARARRWSAAQLTLAGTALLVLLGTPAARV